MAVLTVTPRSSEDFFRINAFFYGVGQGSVRYSSESVIVLGTPDLNRVVLNGTRLQYDLTQENAWAGGIVTSITLWDRAYEKRIAVISGLSIELSDLGPRFGTSIYSVGGLVSYLFSGSDYLFGSGYGESLFAYDGNDTVIAGAGDDDIAPGAGNDTVNGGAGYDFLTYWNYEVVGGNDTTPGAVIDLQLTSVVDPWGGTDQLVSIEGVEGTAYADTLTGNDRDNSLYGLEGNDHLIGLGGNDFFVSGQGVDTVEGGGGFDTVSYADYAGAGSIDVDLVAGTIREAWGTTDNVSDIEAVRGTGNGDKFLGSDADENFQGMGGSDTIDGGEGDDTASYSADKTRGGLSGVSVDLAAGTARDGFGSSDILISIEKVFGTAFADTLYGSGLANTLSGGSGNDRLDGRGGADVVDGGVGNDSLTAGTGNDWLYGGTGKDTLVGGSGRDGFVFDTKASAANIDKITDFSARDDTIWLDNAAFTKLKLGGLSASAFHIGTMAHDSSDRIIYDKATGALYYDPDGTGLAAQVKFALVGANKALTSYDFYVY
ncbi:calcium-binding protein [Microvirga sp. KLBC 81]|uniref:calcium-binding protein n=1 Tax=Microvirga sp. KLBC 81 TaxID=1862707 RepID=UPI0014041FFA|nr:calcium-binding protein [Microvirga sp. KLBC 81]